MYRSSGTEIIRDVLETDVYDCSMINAVIQLYPDDWAWYTIVDRGHEIYPHGFAGLITEKFQDLRNIGKDAGLRNFLRIKWNFLSDEFFTWLENYKFVPEYIHVWQDEEGHLFGDVVGPWSDVIFMEQIIMAVVSQTRNEELGFEPDDDWLDELLRIIYNLREGKLKVSEFGLRRRAYNWMQDLVTEYLIKYGGDMYVGSSSPYHSAMSGQSPKGTVAHLWYLYHGARYGIEQGNQTATVAWRAIYGSNLGTALPDTWGTRFYYSTMAPGMARLIKSFRHDSGSPIAFTDDSLAFLTHPRQNVDPGTVTLMYTDSLSDAKAREIDRYATRWFNTAYGIGGWFTNNENFFKKTPLYRAPKMVIKPYGFSFDQTATWELIAKVPDGTGKNVGDAEVVRRIQAIKAKYPWVY